MIYLFTRRINYFIVLFMSTKISEIINEHMKKHQTKAKKKKNFGSGQLIFENWSFGPVEVFFFFGTTTYIFQILFFNKS